MADTEPHDVNGEEAGDKVQDKGDDGGEADAINDADGVAAGADDKVDAEEVADKQDNDGDGRSDDQQEPPEDDSPAGEDDPSGNADPEADGPQDTDEGVAPEVDDVNDGDGQTSPTQDGGPQDEEAAEAVVEENDRKNDEDDGVGDEGVGEEGVVDDGDVDDVAEEEGKEDGKINGAPVLTEEQRARCRQLFDRQAVNGRLDIKGFKTLFRLMGEVLSSSDAEQMFDEGDKDDNGTIEYEEFSRLYALYSQEEETRKQTMMESIEKLFPSNGDQHLELKKVEQVLLKLQHPGLDLRLSKEKSDLCPEDIKSLVRAMDADGSGKISKKEFVDTLCQHIEG